MNHDHSHGMGKHMLLMAICCLVPLGLIVLIGTFGLSLGPLQGLLPYAAALMCPLMMIFMMRGMMQGESHEHQDHHTSSAKPNTLRTLSTHQIPETTQGTVQTQVGAGQEKCH